MLDLLLPQRCLVCSLPGAQVCDGCTAALRRIGAPLCARCGAPTAWPVLRCGECIGRRVAFAHARGVLAYDDRLRQVIVAWKERGLRRLARWAAAVVRESVPPPDAACVVFVPGDPDRRLKRGHHAAEQLASELAAEWGLPLQALLTRARGSPRQRGLTHDERRRNVGRAFVAHGRVPARVVLIDDVYTTGATANAAASALRKGGARRVEVVTLARAIRLKR
ncbi:MAG: double zinc ribbon domain-containing protein [Actinomycetota bacterium]|nr:double zinc ribbon domain-containing protein [Actinomycetota bacterium]